MRLYERFEAGLHNNPDDEDDREIKHVLYIDLMLFSNLDNNILISHPFITEG
jgi:hypothetical protein